MADKNDFIAASGIMAKFEVHAKGLEASVNREYRAGLLKGYEFICEEEPADVRENVHGKWNKFDRECAVEYICSECNFSFTEGDPKQECTFLYCPICGTRMDGDINVTKNS